MSPRSTGAEAAARLRLGPVYLVPADGGSLTVRTPLRSAVLRGRFVTEILPHLLTQLDGTKRADEVVAAASDRSGLSAEALDGALRQLIGLGVIEEVEETESGLPARLRSQSRFLRQRGGDAGTMSRIASAKVLLAGEGPLLPEIVQHLAAAGVAEVHVAVAPVAVNEADLGQSSLLSEGDLGRDWAELVPALAARIGAGCEIVPRDLPDTKPAWQSVMTDCDAGVVALTAPVITMPWLGEFNRAALAVGMPWTSGALLSRAAFHVGPTVLPRVTACWRCYEERFKSNIAQVARYEEFIDHVARERSSVDQGGMPGISGIAAGLVALEAQRVLAGDNVHVRTAGVLLTFDSWQYETLAHTVLKLPRCPDCSPAAQVPPERCWS